MSTHGTSSTSDDTDVQALRARFEAAAPQIEVEPWPLVERGRRRRRTTRALSGVTATAATLALAVVLVPALGGEGGHTRTAGPPAEDPGPVSLWLTADRVPPGAVELGAVLINRTDTEATFDVRTTVERWTDTGWHEVGFVDLCQNDWLCTATVEPIPTEPVPLAMTQVTVPAGSAGPLEQFTLDGMEPGWYRLSRDTHTSGVIEVSEGAPLPAPMQPTDVFGIGVRPAALPTDGGDIVLAPIVPFSEKVELGPDEQRTMEYVPGAVRYSTPRTLEHVERVLANLSATATVQRWTGDDWETVTQITLTTRPHQDYALETEGTLGALEPGEYRVLRTGPDSDHTGRFWVLGP